MGIKNLTSTTHTYLLLGLDDVETEPLVELDGRVVIDLHVQQYGVKVAVLFHDLHHVVQHLRADPQAAVRSEAT